MFREKPTRVSQILNLAIRFLQFVLALTVLGLYGTDLDNARKQGKYTDSKWVFAEVVGALAAVTALIYMLPLLKYYWTFGWDVVILYVGVSFLFFPNPLLFLLLWWFFFFSRCLSFLFSMFFPPPHHLRC